jgi:nicotinate-nucleotide pyrophosphorylase
LIIYIYGSKKFKKDVKKILNHSIIDIEIDDITSLDKLKSTIKSSPTDIFLIDNDKIIKTSKFITKINIFKPKDGIEKSFLDKYGIGDICFNTMSGFIHYILNRIELQSKEDSGEDIVDEEEQYDFSNSIDFDEDENSDIELDLETEVEEETIDRGNIISIDDIYDEEMEEAIDEFHNKKQNSEE